MEFGRSYGLIWWAAVFFFLNLCQEFGDFFLNRKISQAYYTKKQKFPQFLVEK
jgi:hypothetical protein